MDVVSTIYIFGVMIVMAISGWLVTRQVRRRMKKTLGRNPNDLEMASLKTWMQVDEAEDRDRQSGPIHPR